MVPQSPTRVCNLPSEVTSFVGRRREAADLRRLVSVSRMVTVTGAGGVGKTRLALHVAQGLRRAFHAVWLVELAGLRNADLLPQTVAATVGLRAAAAEDQLPQLTEFLGTHRNLLILDNCEHLTDACAELAGALLRATDTLQILATSRQSLHVYGEHIFSLSPLPVPSAVDVSPEELGGNEAIDLFAQRAAAVTHEFSIERDGAAVATLCRQLDGIPLAIELAAAQLRGLPIEAIVDRLGGRYRLLTGAATAPPRQRSMRALIDWSYRLLSEPEQTIWPLLSVFRTHFDLEAAEVVCAGSGISRNDVADLLFGLVDKSLLGREDHNGWVRYRMLETLRQFGDEKLADPAQRRAQSRRHRDWYLQLSEQSAAAWFGPEQPTWFRRLKLEQDNLRAALEFCLAEPAEVQTGLRMATALYAPYWLANSYVSEGRHWLDRLLRAAPSAGVMRARALIVNARLALLQGQVEMAHTMIEEARASAERLRDSNSLGHISYLCGLTALHQGDYPAAARMLREAVDRHTENGDLFGTAMSSCNLAIALGQIGQIDCAVDLCEKQLEVCSRHGESWCRLYLLKVLALELWRRGETERAAAVAHEGLLTSRTFDDRVSTAISLELLAWLAETDGDHLRAARLLGAAEGVARTVGAPAIRFERDVEHHEECVRQLRDQLGERAFTKAIDLGRRLPVDRAIEEGLGPAAGAREAPRAGAVPAVHSPLTAREREVAELIAQGLTNKEISAKLVIAQRTAEGHVERILTKLDFSSRAQIAAWITRDASDRQQ